MTAEQILERLYPNRKFSFTPIEVIAAMHEYAAQAGFTLEDMMDCYHKGAVENFKFSGPPSEFRKYILENMVDYLKSKKQTT